MNDKIASEASPAANLENLKNQAKRLLRQCKANDPHALSRARRAGLLDDTNEAQLKLADAQRVIARENGCGDWSELKALVRAENLGGSKEGAVKIAVVGIDQIWLDCDNIEKADTFYGEILGLRKTGEVPGMMHFYDCGGTTLVLGAIETVRPNSILYFNVGDTVEAIQAAYNALKRRGVSMGDSPHCIARNWNGRDVWVAFFKDPFGNQLAFKCNALATTDSKTVD